MQQSHALPNYLQEATTARPMARRRQKALETHSKYANSAMVHVRL
jgi:hypothetical protein